MSQEYFQDKGFDGKLKIKKQRKIPSKAAYICVFDNKKWIPVHYGLTKADSVTFTAMRGNIVYLPAFYNGKLMPADNPFLLDSLGAVVSLNPNHSKTETLVLERKFHSVRVEEYRQRMLNGRFQGANCSDFSDAEDLHVINE